MRLTVPQKDLLQQLQKLFAVVPSKTTHPILNNILFSLQKNELHLTATDLEVSLKSTLTVEGGTDGDLAIPAKRLLDIVKELDELPVNITTDASDQVEISCGSARFNIPSEKAEAFPVLPEVAIESEIEMQAKRLAQHVERLSFAVSTDELRPVLTGVLFEFMAEGLNLVATDGHRLVRIKDASLAGQEALGNLVIPIKALNMVVRSGGDAETVTVGKAQNHLVFGLGSTQIFTRLIDGRYPAYGGVIPDQNDNIMQAGRGAIYRAIKQVSHCANSITRQVNLNLSENRMLVTAEDNEYGSRARNELSVDYNGDPMEIAFNSSYLDQMLRHVDTDNVVFKFGSPERAALILPEVNQENEDFLMLLMPVRLMRS
jgi:DNA polymerase-3 subunit beta